MARTTRWMQKGYETVNILRTDISVDAAPGATTVVFRDVLMRIRPERAFEDPQATDRGLTPKRYRAKVRPRVEGLRLQMLVEHPSCGLLVIVDKQDFQDILHLELEEV